MMMTRYSDKEKVTCTESLNSILHIQDSIVQTRTMRTTVPRLRIRICVYFMEEHLSSFMQYGVVVDHNNTTTEYSRLMKGQIFKRGIMDPPR